MYQPIRSPDLQAKIADAAHRFSLKGLMTLAMPEARRLFAQFPDAGLTEEQIMDAIVAAALKAQGGDGPTA